MKNAHSGMLDKLHPGHRRPESGGTSRSGLAPFYDDEYVHLIAENARDLIFHAQIQPEFRFDYVSPSSTRMTGYTPEEFYADPALVKKCIHPDDFKLFVNHSSPDAPSTSKPLDVRWICKDGHTIWTEQLVTITRNSRGKPVACNIIARDITERKHMGEEVRMSEEKYRHLFDNLNDAAFVADIETGIIIETNRQGIALLGRSRDEIIGMHQSQLHPSENPEEYRQLFRWHIAQGYVSKEEGEVIRKDGTIVPVMISASTLTINGKNCLLGMFHDITERKKAEAALLETQKFNASLLENSPHGTVVINPDTSIKYVNPAWEKLNGWTLAEVVGMKTPYPWWPVEFREAFAEGFKEAMKQAGGKAEVIAQKKNGEIYWIEMNWASVMNNGELLYLLIKSVDITERKRMEQALRESEEKFSKAFASSPNIMAITTLKDGRYLEINESFTRGTGYTREEIIGRTVQEINTWANQADRQKMLHLLRENGSIYNEEFQFLVKSGEAHTMLFSVEKIKIGDETCLISVCNDITERKRMEQALRESEEKFAAAFHSSPDMIIITDTTEGKYIDVNDSFVQNTGYTREELVGHSISEFNLWVDPAEVELFTRTLQEQGKVKNEVYKFRRKTGEVRTWLCSADVVTIGGEIRMLAVAADITERKKAEEALKESEEKFSKAFNASPFSISISRLGDGKFVEVNESFLRDKGYTREELIGYSSKDFNIWANKNESMKLMKIIKSGGHVRNQQLQYRTKAGHIRTGLVSAEVINISNEPCMLVVNSDITQQKLAEEQLRLLSSVTQQVSDSTIITDPHLKITYINQAAQDLFGYTIEEVRGKSLSFFDEKPLPDDVLLDIREKLSKRKLWRGTNTKRHKNGNSIICDCRVSPLYDEKGQISSFIDIQRDVTRQKEVETKLQEHKKLIDSILATMPEGVLVIDRNNHIVLANKAFCDIFHIQKTTIKNKDLNEILPVDRFFDLHKAVKSGVIENNTLEFRYQSLGLDKIIYCIIVKMDGERTLLTFSDISKERDEEEKLYLTDRLASLGEMAAGLAHELNNPLTGILALSQMLVGSNLPEEHKEDLECIYSEAKRAAAIVKNVLLFARNKTDVSGRTSINDVVTDVLRLREYEEKAGNIKVVTELEENLPEIPIDKGQLQQVFLNFISNAEAAIREVNRTGVITVTTQRTNNHVNILFSDNGCGIKKDVMPRIFDPFFTTKEIGKGTGLGLSICYSIIVKHGGKISVKSQVNEGTTFTIRMPIVIPER